MPPLERTDRHQHAVWWQASTITNGFGQLIVTPDGRELMVRWNNTQRTMLDANGNTVAVDATVVVGLIGVDGNPISVGIGDIFWLGRLIQLVGSGVVPTSNLMVVKVAPNIPDLKARNVRHEYGLMRFNDTMPLS
jgi:hypothetical protein